MKKLLSVILLFSFIAAFSPPAQSQIVKRITTVKDSTVNADNTTIAITVDATVKSVEVHATKVSGTIAGKAVFEGLAPDGTNWLGIDSLTLADQAVNFKLFTIPTNIPHSQYRLKVTETGTGKLKPIVGFTLRRS